MNPIHFSFELKEIVEDLSIWLMRKKQGYCKSRDENNKCFKK